MVEGVFLSCNSGLLQGLGDHAGLRLLVAGFGFSCFGLVLLGFGLRQIEGFVWRLEHVEACGLDWRASGGFW